MTNLVDLSIPVPQVPDTFAQNGLPLAEILDVNSQATLDLATEELNAAMEQFEQIDAMRKYQKAPALEACKRVDEFFRPLLEPREKAAKILRGKIANYVRQQERERAEAIARAREAERIERERIAKEAAEAEARARTERERLEAEAKAQAEAGNVNAAAQLQQEAERAELAGVQEAQEQLALIESVQVPVEHQAPELTGVSKPRALYSCEVVDLATLVRAVAEGRASMAYLQPNQEVLDRTARALQDQFRVEGCKLVVDYTVARKPRRKG